MTVEGREIRGPQPPDLPQRLRHGKRLRSALAARGAGYERRRKRQATKALGAKQPKRPKLRAGGFRRARKGLNLLALLRKIRRTLKQGAAGQGPRDWRNHGYKGVRRRGRTGLGGR